MAEASAHQISICVFKLITNCPQHIKSVCVGWMVGCRVCVYTIMITLQLPFFIIFNLL